MRVALAVLAGFLAAGGAGLSSSVAKAEWSGWYSVGGSVVGEPSIVHFGKTSENVAVLGRGDDNALWYTLGPDGIVFGQWKSKGGELTAPPSCVSRATGILDCYVRGSDGSVHQMQLNKDWGAWVAQGGQISSNPAAIGKFPDSTVVYAISDKTLFDRRWTEGVGWAEWKPVPADPLPSGATLECDQSQPGVAHHPSGLPEAYFREYRVLCLFRHSDNAISGFEAVTYAQNAANDYVISEWLSTWQGSLPEIPQSAYRPDVVLTGWDSGHVFVVGLDGTMQTATWKSGVGFGPWENLGGGFTSGPSCHGKAGPDYTMICAGRGLDGAVWVNRLKK